MAFESVWLATDLGDDAVGPYLHAMRIGAGASCPVTVLHVQEGGGPAGWEALPTPEVLAGRWAEVDLPDVEREVLRAASTTAMLGPLLTHEGPALLVLGTHRPSGIQRWLRGSVSEILARRSMQALIVPDGVTPFVDPSTGRVRLRRVIVPVGHRRAQVGLDAAAALLDVLQVDAELVLVHVGDRPPHLQAPSDRRVRSVVVSDGDVAGRVLEVAMREGAELIVMATDGHDSLADHLWGSRTERVIRDSPVAVLSVRVDASSAASRRERPDRG